MCYVPVDSPDPSFPIHSAHWSVVAVGLRLLRSVDPFLVGRCRLALELLHRKISWQFRETCLRSSPSVQLVQVLHPSSWPALERRPSSVLSVQPGWQWLLLPRHYRVGPARSKQLPVSVPMSGSSGIEERPSKMKTNSSFHVATSDRHVQLIIQILDDL